MATYGNNINLFQEDYKKSMNDPMIVNKDLFLHYCQERSLDLLFQVCSNIELQLNKLNSNIERLNKDLKTGK
jgi:hypothetical protein